MRKSGGLSAFGFDKNGKMNDPYFRSGSSTKSIPKFNDVSPTKSIYDLVKQDIKMPEGLLYRGKYVGQSKNKK